ncbi:hypothetical protein HHI36_022004 [Cryptolaemus montrouzieri]|uniref:Cation-transporting ATPase n=1 Tax=Cryptolaemus montrouzieri TaxID=559131 RepID=A0ABD2MZF5_9CUCU
MYPTLSVNTDDFDAKYKQQSLSTNSVPSRQQILYGEDDQMEIVGFRFNKLKNYLTWFLYVLSGGLVRLFFHWYPQIKLYATHTECDLEVAERVMIIDIYKSKFKSYYVEAVHSKTATLYSEGETQNYNGDIIILRSTTEKKKKKLTLYLENGKTLELSSVRTINFKKMLYAWNPEEKQFLRLIGLDFGKKKAEFHSYQGMNEMEQSLRRIIYGRNEINIPVQSIFKLFVLEASTPFYVFQVFSVLLWIAEYYFYYGIAIVMMSAYGISSSIIQTRTNQRNLKGTVFSEDTVTVMRGENVLEQTKTSNLVPGDVITIPSRGCNMQCDAVLLKGTCIVNESMLTGESIPVHKTPLPNDSTFYHVKEDSNHTLFCGTTVLQTKFSSDTDTLAVVIRTGFLTTKGELVRSILYPPPADFRFDQDSYKFIGILCVIAMSGFIYTIITKFSRQLPLLDIIIKALDLITIAIPPALPAAMTVGKLYALDRLRKKNIYCINSRVINVSGSIDCVCFDKTGTLTEDELDMWGVIPVIDGKMDAPVKKIKSMTTDIPLYKGMLTCHSLSIINGKVCGYPLDLKMFESTSWHLQEPANDDVYGKI